VQDDLSKIKNVIHNIRESVKFINHSDSRLKSFCDVVEQKDLKERRLTFQILSTALNFKIALSSYEKKRAALPLYTFT